MLCVLSYRILPIIITLVVSQPQPIQGVEHSNSVRCEQVFWWAAIAEGGVWEIIQ